LPGFEGNDEGELWRAVVQAASGQPRQAAPTLKARGDVFRSYPRSLKMKVGMVMANSALSVGDVLMANSYLQVLAEEKPVGNEIDQLALIEGKVHQLSGDFDAAVSAWEAVEKGTHRPSTAEAIVLRAELLLARKKIEPKEAISALEKLRFSWRGGEFEFRVLHRLGQLYNSIGDYRNGLRTLQEAVTYFRELPESAKVTEEMVKAFDDLYLKDAADSMAPVRAIALFDEFKELAPSGERGDEMIRKLADRLAAVDLLDRAAQLLSDQVQFRLKGVERARVGARLAAVHLQNKQPKEAEAALERSREAGLPADLELQRRHLQARSLVDQGRVPDAERLLERDESPEADELRTEIYWGLRDWPNASKSLQKLVTRSGAEPGKPLSEAQARTILNFAIAVTLSGNERGIVKIRQDFGQAMKATPFNDAFNLIATPNAVGLVDYRSVADRVKVASNFTTFLDGYKQRLKEGKLSSIN
jgi:tetratricopeptide (TPR) repeat protein